VASSTIAAFPYAGSIMWMWRAAQARLDAQQREEQQQQQQQQQGHHHQQQQAHTRQEQEQEPPPPPRGVKAKSRGRDANK
jgi:hypothetical protein